MTESRSAVDMGLRYRKNYYDMTYLCLAEELDTQLLTSDYKLGRSAPPDFPQHRILELRDYSSR